jgi:hypothetical protein
MTITLELPEELERELAVEAERLGLPLPEYVVRVLSKERGAGEMPKTGAELVAYWQREGLVGTRPDITDSQAYARELREEAQRRSRD